MQKDMVQEILYEDQKCIAYRFVDNAMASGQLDD